MKEQFPESDELTATDEEAQKAKRLTDSFMSETAALGDIAIRKPSVAGMKILATARNKFAVGFTFDELALMFPNGADAEDCEKRGVEFVWSDAEMMQHIDHVLQIARLGMATEEELEAWYFDPEAFRKAVFRFANSRDFSTDEVGRMFSDCFALVAEMEEAHVAPAPADNKPVKKKAGRSRRSSSPTRAHSAKNST